MITDPIRGESVPADRVLLAAQLHNDGEHTAAWTALATVTALTPAVQTGFERVCALLVEHQELVEKSRLCADDPRHYVDLHCDEQPRIPLADWADSVCNELDADADQILADARVEAEAIATPAERSVAA